LLLALVYKVLQLLFGLQAALHPELFCWCMTVASSGLAYILATYCVFRLGKIVGLSAGWRSVLTASFGLATVAVIYVQHVNNHIMLLGVAAALMLQAAQLNGPAPLWRLFLLGSLAGLAYAIDLGAGPPLLGCTGLLVAWHCGRRWLLGGCFMLGALPWLAMHHAFNYAVGGTIGPANAVAEYFQWSGCPFNSGNMTGGWHHRSLPSFAVYTMALLFSKRGFVDHNLPLFLFVAVLVHFMRRPGQASDKPAGTVWPVMSLAIGWSAITWLLYAATSRNYSGLNCSIRWLVPLLAPAYYALAVVLARMPRFRPGFLVLSAWGMVLMASAWWYGPWIGHMVPGYWFIQAAAMICWGVLAWLTVRKPAASGHEVQPPHFVRLRVESMEPAEYVLQGEER
jgi:hypothetical protein